MNKADQFAKVDEMLKKTEQFIESCEVDDDDDDSFHTVTDELLGCINEVGFEFEIERYANLLNPCKQEDEMNALFSLQERFDRLYQLRDAKLSELGYEPD